MCKILYSGTENTHMDTLCFFVFRVKKILCLFMCMYVYEAMWVYVYHMPEEVVTQMTIKSTVILMPGVLAIFLR